VSQNLALPHPNCYRIPGSSVIAGEYPFHPNPTKARAKLCSVLDAGVTTFLDLTEATEHLEPYEIALREVTAARGGEVAYHRMPIADDGIPTREQMVRILDRIAAAEAAGHTVYVHCWGGVGRTGTVVGCYLVRNGHDGDDALRRVNELFKTMSEPKRLRHRLTGSPQTEPQRDFVRTWAEAHPSTRAKDATDRRASRIVERLLQEHGSARSALRAIEEIEERERRELSVMERYSGPLGAQAAREEAKRRLCLLAAQEAETASGQAVADRDTASSSLPGDSRRNSERTDLFGEPLGDFEVDIDEIIRELHATPDLAPPTLLPVVRAALDEGKLKYTVDEEHACARFYVKGKDAGLECMVFTNEKSEVVRCYVRVPIWVPEASRAAMCEAIARANYNLPFGNFELDVLDGELRYKTSIDVEGGELVPTMVHNLIGAGIAMCNHYHPAFMRIIYGGMTPEQAIEEVEG
jgi:hypothetical protein